MARRPGIWFFLTVLLSIHLTICLYSSVPPGFEVYFNSPTGSADANSPGINIRFKNFVDAAENTIIYAAFYDIDNVDAITALNSALNRGCTVYLICDADQVSTNTFSSITISPEYKVRTSSGSEVHNKFCVIKDSSVWTGSWNATDNGTYQNNNNAIIIRSTSIAEIYYNEFWHMWDNGGGGTVGSAKTLTANNGKTEYVNGVKVKIYFSPYSSPTLGGTNKAISNEIIGTNVISSVLENVSFCLFSFAITGDSQIYDSMIDVMNLGIDVYGIFDITQGNNQTTYANLRSSGAYVTYNASTRNIQYNLHHKFAVIDPFTTNAKVITGSHNWSASANEDNDENTLIIYSTGIAQAYYEEFQKLYIIAGPVSSPLKNAVDNVVIYPSPARGSTKIGYDVSSGVMSVTIQIYSLSGELVKEINPSITPGTYNEVSWDCSNDDSETVASGLYIVKVNATTADETFFVTEKFAVIKGKE